MLQRTVWVCALVGLAACAAGCSGGRDVDVSGSVATQAGLSVKGPITVNFLDVVNDTDPPKSAGTTKLDAPGDFEQKVSIAGDTVRVFALVDANGDGQCTAGEAWAESNAPVSSDDKVDKVALTLAAGSCPTDVGE